MGTLKYYDAPETISYNSNHTVKMTFLYGEHRAEVITMMGGNTYGADLLGTYNDLGIGLTVPVDHELTKKHCIIEDTDKPFAEVEDIRFMHPERNEILLPLEEAGHYLIGLEIVNYEEDRGDEE